MLGSVAKPINALQGKRLFFSQEANGTVRQGLPDACVEAKGLLGVLFTDPATPMHDACLEEHLERVIQENQDGFYPPAIVWSVEELDR
jgi:hypothetical protein